MRRTKKGPPPVKTLVADGVFLDPATCGSSIHYNIDTSLGVKSSSVEAEVCLTDCHRTIKWSGYQYGVDEAPAGLTCLARKLEVAINTLTEAREKVLVARDKVASHNRKVKK